MSLDIQFNEMLFALLYLLFAIAVILALGVAFWKRRRELSIGRILLYLFIPIAVCGAPFLLDEFYGIHIVENINDLPVDDSFLDGVWMGQVSSDSKKIEIAISRGEFQVRNLPHTARYRDGGSLEFQSFSGSIEYEDWASGAAILFNRFDPVYIARQSGHWRLVQNLDVNRGSRIVYRKTGTMQDEALKP